MLYVNAKARKCLGKWLFYAYCAKGSRVSSVGERERLLHIVCQASICYCHMREYAAFFYFFQPSSGAVVIFTSRLIIEDLSKERMLAEHHHQHSTKIY